MVVATAHPLSGAWQEKLVTCAAAIIVGGIVLLVFHGTLKNDFVGWDDEIYVTRNPALRALSPATLAGFFTRSYFSSYTPLTLLSHAADVALWGFDPHGHHATSLVLHACNAVWVFLLCLALCRRTDAALSLPGPLRRENRAWAPVLGAAAGALLFALHPLRVESVACVSDRKDLLAAFFLFPSILAYVTFVRGARWRRSCYVASLSLYVAAMLSKGVPLLYPLFLLAMDLLVLGRVATWGEALRALREKIPFFAVSFLLGIIAASVAPVGQANAYLQSLAPGERLLAPLFNLSFYLWKTAVPVGLAIVYAYPAGWTLFAGAACTVAVALATGAAYSRGSRWWVLSLGFYVLMILPVAGIIPSSTQPLADRYAYIPALGFSLCGARALTHGVLLGDRWKIMIVVVVLIVAASLLSARQVTVWGSRVSVWNQAVAVSPQLPLAHYNEGLALQVLGDIGGAEGEYERALVLEPGYADALVNMGNIQRTRGRPARARALYYQALRSNPRHEQAAYNLALLALEADSLSLASGLAGQILSDHPESVDGLLIRAQVALRMGDKMLARELFSAAVEKDPSNAPVVYILGLLETEAGNSAMGRALLLRAADLGLPEAQAYVRAHPLVR